MNITEEKWKEIENCSNYKINKDGKVLNVKSGKILNGSHRNGYSVFSIRDNSGIVITMNTHIAVAKAFVPNPNNKPIVNHKDENKGNPRADNLEWVTHKENTNYGQCPEKIGMRLSVPINEYDLDGTYIRTWKSSQFASLVYGVNARVIQNASQLPEKKSKLHCKTSCGRQWRIHQGNIDNIEPIYSKHARHYIGNANYMVEVPEEYLYSTELTDYEKCIEALDEVIANDMRPKYQTSNLFFIKDFITKKLAIG